MKKLDSCKCQRNKKSRIWKKNKRGIYNKNKKIGFKIYLWNKDKDMQLREQDNFGIKDSVQYGIRISAYHIGILGLRNTEKEHKVGLKTLFME